MLVEEIEKFGYVPETLILLPALRATVRSGAELLKVVPDSDKPEPAVYSVFVSVELIVAVLAASFTDILTLVPAVSIPAAKSRISSSLLCVFVKLELIVTVFAASFFTTDTLLPAVIIEAATSLISSSLLCVLLFVLVMVKFG